MDAMPGGQPLVKGILENFDPAKLLADIPIPAAASKLTTGKSSSGSGGSDGSSIITKKSVTEMPQ